MNIEFEDFIIDEMQDIEPLLSLQRIFGIPVWFAISTPGIQYNTWYWISLDEILEQVEKKQSRVSSKGFRPISLKKCTTIGWDDGLDKLVRDKL